MITKEITQEQETAVTEFKPPPLNDE